MSIEGLLHSSTFLCYLVLPTLIPISTGTDLNARNGSMMAIGKVCLALRAENHTVTDPQCLTAIAEIEPKVWYNLVHQCHHLICHWTYAIQTLHLNRRIQQSVEYIKRLNTDSLFGLNKIQPSVGNGQHHHQINTYKRFSQKPISPIVHQLILFSLQQCSILRLI